MRLEEWQRNLVALVVAQVVSMMAFSFVFPFIPLYVQTLGVSGTDEAAQWAGVIGASAMLAMAIAQPIWGSLSDRIGRRPMVLRSLVGGAICLTLMGFAQSPWQLLILRMLQGSVTGTVAASNALVASSTPKERLGYALGILQVALFVGTSLGPMVGGVVSDTFGYRAAFFVSGALLLCSTAIVLTFCRERFTPPPKTQSTNGVLANGKALFAIGVFPVLVTVMFLIQLGGQIVSPVLTLFVAELSGGENAATLSGAILAGMGLTSAAAALLVGRIGDRIGPRVVLPICLVGAAVIHIPQGMVTDVWQLLVLRVLLGLCLGGLMPTANTLLAGLVPREKRGSAFGFAATATALAGGTAPLLGAGVATGLGMRDVFYFTGVLYALAFVWTVVSFRRLAAQEEAKLSAQ